MGFGQRDTRHVKGGRYGWLGKLGVLAPLGALFFAVTAGLADAQTARVEAGATEQIEAHNECRQVTNNTGAPPDDSI